jgi:lipopolysaccharide export LptBFGC system permease protein LptF
MQILRDLRGDDRRALTRTFGASAAIMIVGTLVFVSVPFLKFASLSQPDAAEMALYLVPQALPLSIPVGLTLGILWGFARVSASRRSRTLILLLGTMASVASFTMLAWVVPTSNQAFRVSMFSRMTAQSGAEAQLGQVSGPPLKGARELTLGELRQLLDPRTGGQWPIVGPSDVQSLALNYHGRWAMAAAPLVLALFAVALSSRRQGGRIVQLLAGCLAIVGYFVVMQAASGLGRDLTLSAFAAAWTPNVGFLILTVAIMKLSSQRERTAAGA